MGSNMKDDFNMIGISRIYREDEEEPEFHLIATARVASMTDSAIKSVIVVMTEDDLINLRGKIDALLEGC